MRNRAKCLKCKDVIESRHKHEFVRCHCEAIAVDGGTEFWRSLGDPKDFCRLDDEGNAWKPVEEPKTLDWHDCEQEMFEEIKNRLIRIEEDTKNIHIINRQIEEFNNSVDALKKILSSMPNVEENTKKSTRSRKKN